MEPNQTDLSPPYATQKRHLPAFLQNLLKRHTIKLKKAEQLVENRSEKTVLWRNCISKYKQYTNRANNANNDTAKLKQARELLFHNSVEYKTMRKTQPGTDNSI